MKLTVLLDNNTFIDRYFLGEPAVSYFIESDGRRMLFDVGYSDAFIRNAQKLKIDLLTIDFLVLSHGHFDHTWGLFPLVQLYTEGIIEGRQIKRPKLVAHPGVLTGKKYRTIPEIGSLLPKEKIAGFFEFQFSQVPVQLTEHLVFLGEIKRITDFEEQGSIGQIVENGRESADILLDDSALVYRSPKGLVVITGCSHSGICNIVETARKVCGDQRIVDIIGGFHLLNPTETRLKGTIEYLKAANPECVHACHCTDLRSKAEMSRSLELKEVGVGLELEF